MDLIRRIALARMPKKTFPSFRTGDTVEVYVKVKEGEKERVQLFTGVVLKTQGSGAGKTFTVRKISSGVGVERTFPYYSKSIDRIDLVSRGKVRRSRLYFLRGLKGRAARLDVTEYFGEGSEENAAGAAASAAAKTADAGNEVVPHVKAKKEKKAKPAPKKA